MPSKRNLRVEHIPIKDLHVDETTQRNMVKARVRYLAKNWDPDKIGTLTVSRREDGRSYIVDGQHRWLAAIEVGLHEYKVRCEVYQNASIADEASQFLALNDVRAVSAIDKFRVGITAGDADVLGVVDIINDLGLRVAYNSSDGHVRCVDRLLAIYRRDPALLRDVLETTLAAWGQQSASLEAVLLSGLSQVLATYNGNLDRRILVAKLKKYAGGPGALVGNAKGLSKIRPITAQRAVAEIVRDTYNKGRREELPAL